MWSQRLSNVYNIVRWVNGGATLCGRPDGLDRSGRRHLARCRRHLVSHLSKNKRVKKRRNEPCMSTANRYNLRKRRDRQLEFWARLPNELLFGIVWVHPSIEPLLVYDCIAKFFCKLGRVHPAAKDAEYLALGNIQHNVTDHLSGAPKLIAQSVPGIAQQKKGVFRA